MYTTPVLLSKIYIRNPILSTKNETKSFLTLVNKVSFGGQQIEFMNLLFKRARCALKNNSRAEYHARLEPAWYYDVRGFDLELQEKRVAVFFSTRPRRHLEPFADLFALLAATANKTTHFYKPIIG